MKTLESALGRGIPSGGGGEVRYACPFCLTRGHGEDTKNHLYVNEFKGVFYCHRCNSKGVISYLYELFGVEGERAAIPTADILDEIRGFLEGKISLEEDLKYPCEVEPVVPGMKGYTYLCGARGYSDWVIHEHRIVEGVHPKYGRRVFVPTYVRGKIKYWVGRAIDGQQPKYINPPVPKTCIFNLNNVPAGRPLIICEGVFSAISCHCWATALYGKTCTPSQLLALQRFNPPMYLIALDGDAREEAVALAESLVATGKPVRIIEIPDGEDPDSLAPGDLWKLPITVYGASYRLDAALANLK